VRSAALALALLACDPDAPTGCQWAEYTTLTAPGDETDCIRYYVTHGSDSCVRAANDNACECDSEIVVRGGSEVVWMFDYYANYGGIGIQWEPTECP
jgi:hypothetical protein